MGISIAFEASTRFCLRRVYRVQARVLSERLRSRCRMHACLHTDKNVRQFKPWPANKQVTFPTRILETGIPH